jgi:hypothetical protein
VEPVPPPVPEKALEPTINRIEEKVKILEEVGRKKGAVSYDAARLIADIAFVNLMLKYGAKCIVAKVEHPQDFDIGIKINSVKSETIFQRSGFVYNLGTRLKDCIDRGVQLIVIPLKLRFGKSKTTSGHANMLVYRPFQRLVERYEPHGRQYGNSDRDNDSINEQLKQLFEEDLTKILGPIRYRDPDDICPSGKGFQSLESQLGQIRKEGGGFCSMWSLFLAEMTLLNPTKSTKEILDEVFEITKRDPQYLRSVIRGYVVEVEKGIDMMMKALKMTGFSFDDKQQKLFDKIPDLIRWLTQTVFDTKKFADAPPEFQPLPGVLLKTKSDTDREKEHYTAILNGMTKKEIETIYSIYGVWTAPETKEKLIMRLIRVFQSGQLKEYGATGLRDIDTIWKYDLHKENWPYRKGMAQEGYFTDLLDSE